MFSFVQALCALTGIFALASVLTISLSGQLRTMVIAFFISYLIVAFENSLSALLGKGALSLLFEVAGVLIVAIALVAMKAVRIEGNV